MFIPHNASRKKRGEMLKKSAACVAHSPHSAQLFSTRLKFVEKLSLGQLTMSGFNDINACAAVVPGARLQRRCARWSSDQKVLNRFITSQCFGCFSSFQKHKHHKFTYNISISHAEHLLHPVDGNMRLQTHLRSWKEGCWRRNAARPITAATVS